MHSLSHVAGAGIRSSKQGKDQKEQTFTGVPSLDQRAQTFQQRNSNNNTSKAQDIAPKILKIVRTKVSQPGRTYATEREIRNAFGNMPDVSKALRMLVVQKTLCRIGRGGKADPFRYMFAKDAA